MTKAAMISMALAFSSVAWIHSQAPPAGSKQDEASPYMREGSGTELLDFLNRTDDSAAIVGGDGLRDPAARHAALAVLETLPDTTAYVDSALIKALMPELESALTTDLTASVWADMTCAPGEASVIRICCARAGRFKQASLPALWRISKSTSTAGILGRDPKRLGARATMVMKTIVTSSKDTRGLTERLHRMGEKELAAAVAELRSKK